MVTSVLAAYLHYNLVVDFAVQFLVHGEALNGCGGN